MYLAINQVRQSPAFKLTQSQDSRHTIVSMPPMPHATQGLPLDLKLCRNYFNYHMRKATGPLQ
eukprot:4528782-Karenia_brevis.AAC.1